MRADRAKVERLLKTARGQIDGVLKMAQDDRYCIDVINQILACEAVLKKTAREILAAHIHSCVNQAFFEGSDKERREKVDEVITLIDKMRQ